MSEENKNDIQEGSEEVTAQDVKVLLKLATVVLSCDRQIIQMQKTMIETLVSKLKKYEDVTEYEEFLKQVEEKEEEKHAE